MLTCPPTRLSLTAADIARFDRKFTAKQNHQQTRSQNAGIKIGQAPGHLTRNSIVPGAVNIASRRAQSRASKAAVCVDGDDHHTANDGEHTDMSTHSLLVKPTHSQPFHGATDLPSNSTIPTRHTSSSETSREISSRTRLALRQDFVILEEPETVHRGEDTRKSSRKHEEQIEGDSNTSNVSVERPIPAIITQSPSNPSLDPGAPVFVPRTRYASHATAFATTNLSRSSSYSGAEVGRGPQVDPFLRLRSSFERNTQHSAPRQAQLHGLNPAHAAVRGMDGRQARRSSRPEDQNTDMRRPATAPEQYSSVSVHQDTGSRRGSASFQQPGLPYRQSSRQHFEDSRRSHDESTGRRSHVTHLTVPTLHGPRSSSPAGSSSSVSTPNLLRGPPMPHVHHRSSSLSQRRHPSNNFENGRRRAPPPTSRASSASTSVSALDQAWLNRDSPLDELAQLWSRMSTRPRSVGRSFERLPSAYNRPSLLNGDPFRLDSPPDRLSMDSQQTEILLHDLKDAAATEMPPSPPPKDSKYMQSIDSAIESPVAVALAISTTASTTRESSPRLPLTPPIRTSSLASSPVKSTPNSVSVSSPDSSTPRPTVTATPRVAVYNDRLPANTQPETPADIPQSQSRRHYRGRSDHVSASNRTPRSDTPELRHPHRNTYPSAGPLSPVRRNAAELSPQRVGGENDIEEGLDGLEEDRRVWVRRREDGTLDVTPPREGRFERFLS